MVSTFQQPAAAVAPQMFASQQVVGINDHHQHQQQQQHFLASALPAQPTLSAPQNIQLGEGSAVNTAWGGGGISAAPTNGHYLASNATVISNSSHNTIHSINNHSNPQFTQQRQPSSSVVVQLPPSQQPTRSDEGGAVTHPVPEFLCHLFSMVTDPALSHLISWAVPTQNEPDNCGGGFENIGKVVIHDPKTLQDFILGKYYRHSQYSSFQRQLNYFGFKKKIHGGKKGKLCPCSYVHEGLGTEPSTLFSLKRRLRVGGSSSSSNCSSKTKKSSDSVKKSLQSKAPIHSPKNKKKTAASVTSSSTSSSSTNSPRVTNNGHQKIIVKGPASNEAVIVKDSNHSNFLTTLPLPYTNIHPLPTSYNEGQFSALVGNPAPSVGAIPMTQLPSNNWVQVTVGNGNNMLMPFQPQLQVGISNFHQQLFNTNAASLSPPNVQGGAHNVQGTVAPPASSTNITATANFNSTSKDLGNEITIARANEVARAAQKALERAYRKRKQEAADEDVTASKKEGDTGAAAVQQYQQQLQPPPPPPPQVQQMLLPNQFQNLVQQQPGYMAMQNPQQTIPPSTSMEYTPGNVFNAMNNVSADAPQTQTVDYSAMGKQVLTQFNPQYAHLGGATFPHAPPTTEVPMAAPPPLMNAGATASMGTPSLATNHARISSSRANGSSSPVMFDDMFSKLLSTTLPPPEELFDDSSTGQLSDFNEELHALG